MKNISLLSFLFLLFACSSAENKSVEISEEAKQEIQSLENETKVIEDTKKEIEESAKKVDELLKDL